MSEATETKENNPYVWITGNPQACVICGRLACNLVTDEEPLCYYHYSINEEIKVKRMKDGKNA